MFWLFTVQNKEKKRYGARVKMLNFEINEF